MTTRSCLPDTAQLLVQGGDVRIAPEPGRTRNKYGCSPLPDPGIAAFGSSTASTISEPSFAAANRLREKIMRDDAPDAAIYARELDRLRTELLTLSGASAIDGVDVVFAASGTDLHLIAGQLAIEADSPPPLIIMVDPSETGSGVYAALSCRHFSGRSALGETVTEGSVLAKGRPIEVASVAIRHVDGVSRAPAEVDAEVMALATAAAQSGRKVLLILVDMTKTGLIAPSPACAFALQRHMPGSVEVLVDACQFRIAPATVCSYLERGFMVALTGSKFVTGPSFSGALLVPPSAASRLRGRPLSCALRAYSARAEWPRHWTARDALDDTANLGLLLRWEAALEELRAFRSIPETDIERFLRDFATAIGERLASDPSFDPLPTPAIERFESTGWDAIPTIFPFVLHHTTASHGRRPLSRAETIRTYELLQMDLSDACPEWDPTLAAIRCQFGQPVACGERNGIPVSALRLCASSRLVVEAATRHGGKSSEIIQRALSALDKAAFLGKL